LNDRIRNMNIYITGATGLVGQALTSKLLENGDHVKALVRSPQKADKLGLRHKNLTLIAGTLADKDKIQASMMDCEQVYHLAAIAGVWAPGNQFQEVNVIGTRHVMDAALHAGVKKVVNTATAGIIGPVIDGPVNEETKRQVPFFNEYERTKAEAQKLAFSYQEKGLEVVATAPTRIFGPGPLDMSNATTKIFQQYLSKSWYFRVGDGERSGNYVYLPDLIDGHIKAMKKGRSGEVYLLGGEDLNWNELLDLLSEWKGKKLPIVSMPMSLILSIAKMQKFRADTFGRPPLFTPSWVRRYNYNWKVSSQKAQQELGYHITPFREALSETVTWLKNLEN